MPTIAFIGAGNMAEAIARGLLRTTLYQPGDMRATDPNAERQRLFQDELGIPCSGDCTKSAVDGVDMVVLAVKPFVMAEAFVQIRPSLRPEALLISIAAGISTRYIE